MRKEAAFGIAAGVLVSAALILGYQQLGGRTRQRDLRADAARVNDLRAIAVALHEEWMRQAKLPSKLAEVSQRSEAIELRITDPITSVPYEYAPKTGTSYELCATFVAGSGSEQDWPETSRRWTHAKGRYCFALDASLTPPMGIPIPY